MSVKTDNFINKIAPLAVEDMKKTGVLASLTIAQAILESGWGESTLAKQHNNLFGIKANSTWNGESVSLRGSNWRAYGSWDESILDHSKLLQGTRYTKVLKAKDYKEACEEVRLAGYCTEEDYSQKLIKLIEQYDLAKYDTKTTETTSVVTEQDGMYRVRLTWEDSKTQVGAYKNLKNAQKKCDEHLGIVFLTPMVILCTKTKNLNHIWLKLFQKMYLYIVTLILISKLCMYIKVKYLLLLKKKMDF